MAGVPHDPEVLAIVARALFGLPDPERSTDKSLRFGDIELNLETGIFYDYDAEAAVEAVDLVRKHLNLENGAADIWLGRFYQTEVEPFRLAGDLPDELETERQLLGLILVKPTLLGLVEEEIGPTDFLSLIHGKIFAAFMEARDNDFDPGVERTLAALGCEPQAELFKGFTAAKYLAYLMAAVRFGGNPEDEARALARKVRELAEIDRGEAEPEPPPRESKFGLIMWSEQDQPGDEYEYLIEDLVPVCEPVLILGETGSGKSYFTRDMAMAGARGTHFFGRRVIKPFGVVYCAYEAGKGFNNRQKAYRKHHGLDLAELPFALLTRPADLWSNAVNVDQMIEEILWIERTRFNGIKLGAVVIDTHNAATSGASEIDSKEVSTIRDRYLKILRATKAGVWIIGHKNSAGKHRGNEQLFNNIETAIDISVRMQAMDAKTMIPVKDAAGHPIRHAKILKQREGETGALCDFVLASIEIGTNKYGRPRTACVTVDPLAEPGAQAEAPRARSGLRPMTANELVILQALRDAVSDHGVPTPPALKLPRSIKTVVDIRHWREAYVTKSAEEDKGNTINKRMGRASDEFLKRRMIGRVNPWVWIIPPKQSYGDPSLPLPLEDRRDTGDMDDDAANLFLT